MKKMVLISLCFASNFAFAGTEQILTNDALNGFTNEYAVSKPNKAFAQSSSGAWGWVSDRTSPKNAIVGALTKCKSYLNKGEPTCKIINLNDKWIK